MKKTTVLASSLALSLLVAALVGCDAKNVASPDTSKDEPKTKTEAELITLGAQLVKHGECASCHSPIRPVDGVVQPDFKNALLGGGNAWFTPALGIGVSPNLTPGGTVVGNSSVEALVEKWSDKTKTYFPPMPPLGVVYTTEELTAIATYLKSVPAISPTDHVVPASYAFKGKLNNDKTWPVPGWMKDPNHPAYAGADHTGGVIPGNLEVSQAPFSFGAFNQDLINTNIAEANK